MDLFTPERARAELAQLRPVLDEVVAVRADLVELTAALAIDGQPTPIGGLPERKAAEARLDELLNDVRQTGVELKGLAPMLLDFPAGLRRSSGVSVLVGRRAGVGLVPSCRPRLRRPPAIALTAVYLCRPRVLRTDKARAPRSRPHPGAGRCTCFTVYGHGT